jgi:tetratricopeptide (TPR) repeat protein
MPKARPAQRAATENPGWNLIRHACVAIALFMIVRGAFSNSFKSGMVLDNKFIIQDYYKTILQISPDLDLQSTKEIALLFQHDYWWPKGVGGIYRPIATLSYWFNYVLLSDKPPEMSWANYAGTPGRVLDTTSYHWINLLAHWINAVLVYVLALVLLKNFWPAAFVAAIFAAHPITTESVTNIIGRADLFAAMSVIGGLLLYIRSAKSPWPWKLPWLVGLMLVCAFGFFSKESAITIGLIVPLYWFIFEFDWRKENWFGSLISESLAWCFMLPPLVAMLWARWWVFKNSTPAEEPFIDNPLRGSWQMAKLQISAFAREIAQKPLPGGSFLECKITAVKILGKFLCLLAWPQYLSADYSYDQIPNFSWHLSRASDWSAIFALIAILTIFAIAAKLFHRNKPACFFILFFFIAALPTSNLIITIGSNMAERFMYLPLVGFAGIVVMSVFAIARRFQTRGQIIAGIFLSIAILACCFRTYVRNVDWESDIALWESAIKVSPHAFRGYQSLAYALYEKDSHANVDRMIQLDETALPIVDALPDHLNGSRLYLHLGLFYGLKAELMRGNDNAPMSAEIESTYRRGIAILERGVQVDRTFDEINHAKQKLRGDDPANIPDAGLDTIYGALATLYSQVGLYDRAYQSLLYQKHLNPREPQIYVKICALQLAQHQYEAAAASIVETLLMDSNRQELWIMLAKLYASFGQRGAGAILNQGDRFTLNMQQPLVHEQVINAYRDLIRTFRSAKQFNVAEELRKTAVQQFHFNDSDFDEVFREPPMIVTPYEVIYPTTRTAK